MEDISIGFIISILLAVLNALRNLMEIVLESRAVCVWHQKVLRDFEHALVVQLDRVLVSEAQFW